MRVNKELNPIALQHMAQNALEARERAGLNRPSTSGDTVRNTSAEVDAGGNTVTEHGKNLPLKGAAAEHATGLQRAIERLRENAQKSPEAKGLQQALEMLQHNAERSGAVDIEV